MDLSNNEIKELTNNIIYNEYVAIKELSNIVDDDFFKTIDIIKNCKGKVVITGLGKSGYIGSKIASTLSSLGTPSVFVNSINAMHGELGVISKDDCIILISKSGETKEVLSFIPYIKELDIKSIAITNRKNNTLSKLCDISLAININKEACILGISPTTSSTATLVVGDMIAIILSKIKDFSIKDLSIFHQGGEIGKYLNINKGIN